MRKARALSGRGLWNMKSGDVDTLKALISAATEWRNGALGAGVEVTMITSTIAGDQVILAWNGNDWDVRTGM